MKKGVIIAIVAVALVVLAIVKLKSNQHEIQSKIFINNRKFISFKERIHI
jgi:hypothetical protein